MWAGVVVRGIPLIFLDWTTRNKQKNREGQCEDRTEWKPQQHLAVSHTAASVITTFRLTDLYLRAHFEQCISTVCFHRRNHNIPLYCKQKIVLSIAPLIQRQQHKQSSAALNPNVFTTIRSNSRAQDASRPHKFKVGNCIDSFSP